MPSGKCVLGPVPYVAVPCVAGIPVWGGYGPWVRPRLFYDGVEPGTQAGDFGVNDIRVMALAAPRTAGVDPDGLERALCTKSTITRGETIVSPLGASTAQDVCDAFVKGIYGRQFIWVVNKINQVIFKPKVSYSGICRCST